MPTDQTPSPTPDEGAPPASPASAAQVKAWAAHPYTVELPESQLAVRISRVSMLEIVAQGRIPDELTRSALVGLAEAMEEARKEVKPQEARRVVRRRLDLINAVCCAVLVEPRMVMDEHPPANAISPGDLSMTDRVHLYGIAVGSEEGPNLTPFPVEPTGGVGAGEDGADVRDAALELPGAA